MSWNSAAKAWIASAGMADASLNRRQSVRVIGSSVATTQIGIVGFDGQIELEALRLYGLPDAAPTVLAGPTHGWGRREIPFSDAHDPPSPGAGATHQVKNNAGTPDSHDQLRRHLEDFVAAYNFAKRLKRLRGLAPHELICNASQDEPQWFVRDPHRQDPGSIT